MAKFEMIVTARYVTDSAQDRGDAARLALQCLLGELLRWSDGKEFASRMWDLKINVIKESKVLGRR